MPVLMPSKSMIHNAAATYVYDFANWSHDHFGLSAVLTFLQALLFVSHGISVSVDFSTLVWCFRSNGGGMICLKLLHHFGRMHRVLASSLNCSSTPVEQER